MRAKGIASDLIEFCFPSTCAACRESLAGDAFLCEPCRVQLDLLADAAACPRCAMPLPLAGAPCPYCRGGGVPHYETVVTLGRFDEPLKGLIHRMKYYGQWTIGEQLASRLLRTGRASVMLREADAIVPVPLHRFRQVERGYNQAEVIARQLAPGRVIRPIVRRRHTETQTHLHSHARRVENLHDAFGLARPKQVAGKHVVVVDDVMTSGATLQTLARALARGKPRSLNAVVLAIADPKGRLFETL